MKATIHYFAYPVKKYLKIFFADTEAPEKALAAVLVKTHT